MRIALLHPTYWPEVRRGSERMVHDLARALSDRGHEVTLLTSHRRASAESLEEGVRVVRRWRPPDELPGLGSLEYYVLNVPNAIAGLARGDYDVAQALFPADAWAAAKARRWGGPPYVFSFNGIPTRSYLVVRRYRLEMLQAAIRGAGRVAVLSEAAACAFRRYLLHDPEVLPPGVIGERFAVEGTSGQVPTLLCAASLGDPRKRGELLLRAFAGLRRELPQARLLLVRGRDAAMGGAEPPAEQGVEWIDADRTEDLARAYASAWASVLPAPDEAFGLVLIESLAAGTPVVAADAGGPPEILAGAERIGSLFKPDDEADLTRAMREALALADDEQTAGRCRRRASDFDWALLGDRHEAVLEQVAAESMRR